jgi:hypothetical protein
MPTNKRLTKRRLNKTKRRLNKTKRRSNKSKRRNGGMLKKIGSPVLSAVKTVGTEYAKDQAQKLTLGKPNVLGDITNTYKNKDNENKYKGFTPINVVSENGENNENIRPVAVTPRSLTNKDVNVSVSVRAFTPLRM